MGPKVLAGNGLGGYSFPRTHPLEAVCFQTIKQEIRRIPIRILRLAVELLNKETHHRDVMSFFLLNPGPPFIENSSNFLLYRLAGSDDNPLSSLLPGRQELH